MKKFSTTIAILAFSASTFINPALSQDKKGFEVFLVLDTWIEEMSLSGIEYLLGVSLVLHTRTFQFEIVLKRTDH